VNSESRRLRNEGAGLGYWIDGVIIVACASHRANRRLDSYGTRE